MSDLVRREDVIKCIEGYGLSNGSVLGRHSGIAECILSTIERLPTIDAVPVDKIQFTDLYLDGSEAIAVFKFGNQGITLRKKCEDFAPVVHGRWIHDINNLYSCSECMERETMSPKKLKPYCPNCGAEMRGEADV